MTTYTYRCTSHEDFDVRLPMGSAPRQLPCPACDTPARRVYQAPRLSLGSRAALALLDRTERTRHEPDVVTAPAGTRRRRTPVAPANPALARLPRP